MRRKIVIVVVVLIAAAGLSWWWFNRSHTDNSVLVLYGNVDLRQVELAFNDSGRIDAVLVDEGDEVKKGQVVARLDTSRLEPQVSQVQAEVAAQAAVVDKLHNGSRPEEIAQARANVAAAKADADNAQVIYHRLVQLSGSAGGSTSVSQSQLDAGKAAADAANARLKVAEASLALAVAGPRTEEVAQAEAQLKATKAQLALLNQQLADAQLEAPIDGVVRSRLLEPGEMASPQQPVLSLAILDPKWIRAYVSEVDLARIKSGDAATVEVDGRPGRSFSGEVGFISPVSEFTPRSIQTEELRTSLVYEVRIIVSDPDNVLRLGMPATVRLTTELPSPTSAKAEQ